MIKLTVKPIKVYNCWQFGVYYGKTLIDVRWSEAGANTKRIELEQKLNIHNRGE